MLAPESQMMNDVIEFRFPIESKKYSSNQTVCIGLEGNGRWTEEICETEIRYRDIMCRCNQARAQWVSVWTNKARQAGPPIAWL